MKAIISLILALVFCIGLVNAVDCSLGDVDGDGAITGTDITHVKQFIYGKAVTAPCPVSTWILIDVDGDGAITWNDLMQLKYYVSGKPTVNPINMPPVISDELLNLNFDEDNALTINLDNYVSDADSLVYDLSWTSSQPANIIITPEGAHIVRLSAPLNWNSQETISVTVTDPQGKSNTKDVIVNVKPVNDIPVIDSFNPNGIIDLNGVVSQLFSVSASDVDNDILTYSWELDDNIISGETTNSYTFTSTNNALTRNLKLTVSDGVSSVSKTWDVNELVTPSTPSDGGDGPSEHTYECTEADFDCSDWGECQGSIGKIGSQSRSCEKKNSCTGNYKSKELRSCNLPIEPKEEVGIEENIIPEEASITPTGAAVVNIIKSNPIATAIIALLSFGIIIGIIYYFK